MTTPAGEELAAVIANTISPVAADPPSLADRLLAVLMEQPTPTTNEEAEALAERLAAAATDTVREAIAKVHTYWDDVADSNGNRRYGADRACDVVTATLGFSPVKVGDVRYAEDMKAEVTGIDDDGFVGFTVDGCHYTLTLSVFMRNWSEHA